MNVTDLGFRGGKPVETRLNGRSNSTILDRTEPDSPQQRNHSHLVSNILANIALRIALRFRFVSANVSRQTLGQADTIPKFKE